MKKSLLLSILIFLSIHPLFAQLTAEKELAAKIKSFTSDQELKKFLLSNRLIPDTKDTTMLFHAKQVKVDVFKKNLFGSDDAEIVIQLREPDAYSVNFYSLKEGKLNKVPGRIERYFEDHVGFYEQSFSFSFENVYKENEYAVLTKYTSGYNRSTGIDYELLRITQDSILPVHSFNSSSTYSGILIYMYSTQTEYEFKLLESTYPKALLLKASFYNENAPQRRDNGDILRGDISEGTRYDTIIFRGINGHSIKSSVQKKEQIFINSLDAIFSRKDQKCDTNTTLLISEEFFSTYLIDEKQRPQMKRTSADSFSTEYLICCNAFMKDRVLHTVSQAKPSQTPVISKFNIKPPVSEIIKPEINLKRLYFFERKGGEIVYFQKDTVVKGIEWERFSFADPSIIYGFEQPKTITLYSNYRSYKLPLSKIQMYLKPEILKDK